MPCPDALDSVRGYLNLNPQFPTVTDLLGLDASFSNVWLGPVISQIDCPGTPGPCQIDISGETLRAYMKVTHLLNPPQWIQGYYSLDVSAGKYYRRSRKKLDDPWNQAYIDALACHVVGRLYADGLSPHFNAFYGAFTATAAKYSYNLTDDFDSYRQNKWFWDGQKKGLYQMTVLNEDDSGTVSDELRRELFTEFDDSSSESSIQSDEESEEGGSDSEEGDSDSGYEGESDDDTELDCEDVDIDGAIEVNTEVEEEVIDVEAGEIQLDTSSLKSDAMSDKSFASGSDDEDSYKILCDISNFPVMMILTEQNRDTMDSLLDDFDEVGASPGSYGWDLRWSAWIFQVIAALSVVQELVGMTHNDLHTNNIVWSATDDLYLFYKRRDGTAFQVPTFGKIFRIIDFGRSIFTLNGKTFVSDDFRSKNDAGGQYRFKPLYKTAKNPIMPNPSFDLCRLSVSLFQALYPEKPADDGTDILSSEEGLVVMKSVSPLYNVLWKWMIDDDGENVLINSNTSEKYPDFYLYKHIAAHVHGAIPKNQFVDPAFDRFQVSPSDVGKAWSLFC